ncbi:MAG: hypothetical protein EPN91_08225 [Salinibacterium sp.]|nr:MAG: hypothetical protein EPN91_08225 [Salinibacterium sp.]
MPEPTEVDWKTLRDEMVKHLRSTLKPETPSEVVTLMAKFEVKLKGLQTEQEFEALNKRAETVAAEAMQLPEVTVFILTKMTE